MQQHRHGEPPPAIATGPVVFAGTERQSTARSMHMEPFAPPRVHCPFPSALNPHVQDAEAFAVEWSRRFGLTSLADESSIARAHLGFLSGHVYPGVSRDALRVGTAWFVWLMLYDDVFLDKRALVKRLDPARVMELQRRAVRVMSGEPCPADDEPLLRSLADVRAGLLRLRPDWDMRPFLLRFAHYLQSNYWEVANIWDDVTPTVPTYVQMRRQTGSLFATYQVGCVLYGIRLRDEVRDHVALEQLEIMANNYTCWQNDVYSFDREHTDGTVNNLVVVLRHQDRSSFPEALERAAEMCRREVDAYLELRDRLPRLGLTVDAHLRAYLGLLESWMRGLLDWTLKTRRYQVADEERASPAASHG
jgi:hypothetical protein